MHYKILPILLLLLSTLMVSCEEKPAATAPMAPKLSVAVVPSKTITGYQSFPANLEGKNNNDVRAKISGYIQEVYIDEGQSVSKGQALFRLETNTLAENANAAKAGINAAQSSIEVAQARVNVAEVEVNKLIPLVQKDIVSNVLLETAKANLAEAQSQLSQARANYQQSEASLKGIEANINYSVIRSPINGTIGSLPLRVGSLVGPSDPMPITTVSDVSEIYAYFSMNESAYLDFLENTPGKSIADKLKNMPPVDLLLANGSIYSQKGKIQTVNGQIDANTGTMRFRAVFSNADRLLSNGNSGAVRIPQVYKEVVVVPTAATYEQQGLVYVFKVERDTAFSQKINVVDVIDNMSIVSSGIKQGQTIVVSGIGTLRSKTAIVPQAVSFDSIVQNIQPIF